MEKNLTTGSVLKTILLFALPYLFSYFLQTLYGMADLFIIGQYRGVDGITAVSNGGQVMHMLTVIIVGLAMGATVTIGRAVGANRQEEAVEGTRQYLTICFVGIPFITAYNIISSIFRGMGDSRSPMYFIGIACVANIALDYLFMGGFDMGPAGAALGTTLAQTLSVVIALWAIRRRQTGIRLSGKDFRPQRGMLSRILKIGIPVAVQDGCIQIAFIVITVIANHRGLNDAAAVGIVEKVIGALFIVPSSMLAAVSALAAQNIGARKHDRAAKTLRYAIFITVAYGVVVNLLIQLTAESVLGFFTTDAAVILLGSQYIRGYIWDAIFAGVHFCFSGYFCAYGRSYLGFLHNILSITLVRIPGSYLTSARFPDTLLPMGMAAPAGSLLSVGICLGAYLILKRRGVLQKET